jgi:hypothetical protein
METEVQMTGANTTPGGDSGTPEIVIRHGRQSDRAAVVPFVRKAYGKTADMHLERMDWEFFHNPYLKGDAIGLRFAFEGDEIVGKTSSIPVMLKCGEETRWAVWSCELMVLPSQRGRKLGFKLQKTDAEHYPIFISARMAPATWYIQSKVGCLPSVQVWTYVKIAHFNRRAVYHYLMNRTARRPGWNRLVRFARNLGIDVILAGLLNLFGGLWGILHRRQSVPSDLQIREVERFGEEVDRLWEKVQHQYTAIVKRDQVYLNWRFAEHPQLEYRCFLVTRNGEAKGYFVLRKHDPQELSVGYVVDFLTARGDDETLDAIFQYSVQHFGGEVAVVQCEASIPEVIGRLPRHGFLRFRSLQTTYYAKDPEYMKELGGHLSDWYLTRGDQDMDQLRPVWSVNPDILRYIPETAPRAREV